MKRIVTVAAFALLCVRPAVAEVVDFNEFTSSFQGVPSFTSGSLTFALSSGLDYLGVWTTPPDKGAYDGTPYLLDAAPDNFVIRRTDAAAFSLGSFDVALGWYQAASTGSIRVTYDLVSGGRTSVVYGITSDFATIRPGLSITAATFDLAGAPGYISLDNVYVNTVPEPSTPLLLAAGLGLGLLVRRSASGHG